LPGDVVELPGPMYYSEQHCVESEEDPRCASLLDSVGGDWEACETDEDLAKVDSEYLEWMRDYFPAEAAWRAGNWGKDTWRAHSHMANDSYLRGPGE